MRRDVRRAAASQPNPNALFTTFRDIEFILAEGLMLRMKAAVMALGMLAMAKIGTQEYLFRSGTKDVLISAYRERAVAACQKDPRNQGLVTNINVWTKPSDVRVVIGKADLDVWFWQVDDTLWSARYRNPYLYLSSPDRLSPVSCEYDIVHGIATVFRS